MVRFGVVGTNWITESFIEAASKHKDFKLTAIYSRTEERAKEFSSKYQVETIFTSLEEMAKSSEIDAVYIASPNSFHANQACLFMKHHKHVLCEKPMACNVKELQLMIDTAKANNVLLMEALKTTFVPAFSVIKNHLAKIGPVRRYVASYCQYSSRYDRYKEGIILNAFDPKFSNGSLMDIGIYCIFPLVSLFGEPKNVKAIGHKLDTGVDGEGSLILEYDQMDAVIMHSKISNSYLPTEIQGELGTIIIDKLNPPEKVEIKYRDGSTEVLIEVQESNPMYYEVEEFIRLIIEKQLESSVNTHQNSLLTLKIIDEARKQIGIIYPADSEL
ncbi:Gfo/Idh/MocA family oxidoreductase [Anaerobacillus sp. CMMVII]|uniref:Gfo/Idh/MocA family protein n=1 Tax=Anaerobacillus sp. CMMVII TaxID=2755588 RepID=UPI0021B702D8|nr:Gfo/Idh/MocA family oxidoreductase [Anaerobacillus sp. CMMVII]MCT8137160.1 Gfo/Idh/MocA family oxidoreductase [Anaerobacillus sp. CMMVII]